jgi:hypothetical protein
LCSIRLAARSSTSRPCWPPYAKVGSPARRWIPTSPTRCRPSTPCGASPTLTPHIAGAEKGRYFTERLGDLVFQNVSRYRAGEPLLNEITCEEWRQTRR